MIYMLTGITVGIMVPILAVFLMIFKNGIHSHITPDFTYENILQALYSFPIWIAAGTLISLGVYLVKKSFQTKHD